MLHFTIVFIICLKWFSTFPLLLYQDRARILLARYSQRWVKGVARGSLSISSDASDSTSPPSLPPRHSSSKQCLCQYIEDHLHYKPQGLCKILCTFCILPDVNWNAGLWWHSNGISWRLHCNKWTSVMNLSS